MTRYGWVATSKFHGCVTKSCWQGSFGCLPYARSRRTTIKNRRAADISLFQKQLSRPHAGVIELQAADAQSTCRRRLIQIAV